MKILIKLAAALAAAMITALTACGNDPPALFPQEPGTSNVGTNRTGALKVIVTEQGEFALKSKITSADSTSKELIATVNTWIAEYVQAGGGDKYAGELTIRMDNGTATITDTNEKNDWNATKNCADSLKERFEYDYPGRAFTAKVFIDDGGYAIYVWYVPNDASYSGAAPTRADFYAGDYSGWQSENRKGLTEDGVIIGTYPKLHFKESRN